MAEASSIARVGPPSSVAALIRSSSVLIAVRSWACGRATGPGKSSASNSALRRWMAAVTEDAEICVIRGPARAILSGERSALNFMQFLSATATLTSRYVKAVEGTKAKILDTRKTIPGLRHAQKYAVRVGGGNNHRIGLYDALLIKENHIISAGGIEAAIKAAHAKHPELPVEIEVESVDEMRKALAAGADRMLLDNFDIEDLQRAVELNQKEGDPPADLEASGGITLGNIFEIAETGVDYISVGALTKDVNAIDLSMRFSYD